MSGDYLISQTFKASSVECVKMNSSHQLSTKIKKQKATPTPSSFPQGWGVSGRIAYTSRTTQEHPFPEEKRRKISQKPFKTSKWSVWRASILAHRLPLVLTKKDLPEYNIARHDNSNESLPPANPLWEI